MMTRMSANYRMWSTRPAIYYKHPLLNPDVGSFYRSLWRCILQLSMAHLRCCQRHRLLKIEIQRSAGPQPEAGTGDLMGSQSDLENVDFSLLHVTDGCSKMCKQVTNCPR